MISNTTSATAFANAISATSRPFAGLTAIGSAIDFTRPLFGTSGFSSNRLAMDISSDGSDNDGIRPVTASRNDAVNAGITINGLAILTHEPDLVTYFQNNVIGGSNAFVTAASTTADFGTAISQKIFQEVTPTAVPEPSTFVMGGTAALMGLSYGYWRRRRRQATA